jgi:hypothetical protein
MRCSSPVLRDAFEIDQLSKKESDEETFNLDLPIGPRIEMNHGACAIRLLFGVIEDRPLETMGFAHEVHPLEVCSLTSFAEAVEISDEYDIPFFSRLLDKVVWDIARLSSTAALAAYAIAYRLKKI